MRCGESQRDESTISEPRVFERSPPLRSREEVWINDSLEHVVVLGGEVLWRKLIITPGPTGPIR